MILTNQELEDECGCNILLHHQCKQNHLPEHLKIFNISVDDSGLPPNWEFFSIWLANEADVQSGEAEEVGELMNLSSVKINFCPFCGSELE